MINKIVLFSFLLATGSSIAQDDSHSRVKAELIEWDAVRGEWLAESFNAMAGNQPIPDRTFPEDLTPAEMYSLVPNERQERIRAIVSQSGRTSNPRENQVSEPNRTGTQRIPVGENPATNPAMNRGSRYNYYVTRPGCNLTMGRSYGDPHIRTFDGKSYSFQTVGEYVLSSSPDRSFEVQARQKPQTNQVSLNTAVAMNVYGDRVGIYANDFPDGQSGTPVRVNGRAVYLKNETFYLPHGGTIQHTGREYVVTWPTGEKVQAKLSTTSGMGFMNISVYVYECNGDYFGLMGNANGRSDDDFSGGGNRANLASSTIFEPFGSRDFGRNTSAMEREHLAFIARDFGSQFLVNDQTSLFDYGFGQSSWTFYDPSFPRTHLTLGDLSQADRDRARRECERQGILADEMTGCVMDLAHANIQPTPRPSTPNRTAGRDLGRVTERTPNVNRPDIFERERTPTNRDGSSTDNPRTGSHSESGTGVIGRDRTTIENETGATRTTAPATIDGNTDGEPGRTTRDREPDTRTNGTVIESISRPSGSNTNVNGETGKPTENPGRTTREPASDRGSAPIAQPVEKPAAPSPVPGRNTRETSKPVSESGSRAPSDNNGTSTDPESVSKPSSSEKERSQPASSAAPSKTVKSPESGTKSGVSSGSRSGTRSSGTSTTTPSRGR